MSLDEFDDIEMKDETTLSETVLSETAPSEITHDVKLEQKAMTLNDIDIYKILEEKLETFVNDEVDKLLRCNSFTFGESNNINN